MKNPFENAKPSGSNSEKAKEKLIEKALNTLAKNVEFTSQKEQLSLKERILGGDQNPFQLAQGKVLTDFNAVQVEGSLGIDTREGSVFIKPYLSFKAEQQGKTLGFIQPMGIHLEAIEKGKERRLELAEQVWSGVSQEEKVALALKYIDHKKAVEENGILGLPGLVKEGHYNIKKAEFWKKEHKRIIKNLTELRNAILKGNFIIEMSDTSASLIFSPEKDKKTSK